MGLVKGRGAACLPLWGAAERSESEIHSIAGGNVSSFTVAARRADGRGGFRRKLVGSTDKCGTDENRSPLGAPLPPPGGGTLPKGEGKCLPLWGRWQPEGLTEEVTSAGSLSAPPTNVAPTKTEAPSGHLSRPLAGAPSPKGRASAFPSGEGGSPKG